MEDLIRGEALKKYFTRGRAFPFSKGALVKAVDSVDIVIHEEEILGLAGESGCGKTTLGRILVCLTEADEGDVWFMGKDMANINRDELRRMRSKIQIIFQNPFSSLNPRKTIRAALRQPLSNFHLYRHKKEIDEKIVETLSQVGLNPPEQFLDRFPHEFSGGQRQRICIARAILVHPRFIVADEPVSSLDVSIRAQILTLMKELQQKLHLSMLFITHDLAVLRSMAHRIGVMYLGKIVEIADTDDLLQKPLHPYTRALIMATPLPHPVAARKRQFTPLPGEPPSPVNLPPGCRFQPRCRYAQPRCSSVAPGLEELTNQHYVACHHPLFRDFQFSWR